LNERIGAPLPISVTQAEGAPTIATLFQGAQFAVTRLDVNTGVAIGYFACASGRRGLNGVVAAGSLTLTGSCYDNAARAWRTYRIVLEPDENLGLAGEATIEAEKARVTAPLL
jgi:hypothetical protein